MSGLTNLFACEQCGTVDDITLTQTSINGYLCHTCVHGSWHNQFEEGSIDPTDVDLINSDPLGIFGEGNW